MIEQDPNGKSPHQPGAKLDADKPMAGEVLGGFAEALQAVIEVGTHGAKKYTLDGWKAVDDAKRRYTSAMLRHWLAEHSERMDDKSGLTHAAHVAWNALARLHFILQEGAQQPEYQDQRTSRARRDLERGIQVSGTFQGTFPNPVAAGGNLIIRLYDPDRAGQTVSVAAYNPSTGQSTYIPMVLDDDGVGGVKWVVPEDWGAPLLTLQTEDTTDLMVTVTGP